MSAPDRYQLAGIHHLLKWWGAVTESTRNWSGYPSSDTTYRAAHGRGGASNRLPIPDIPTVVVRVNAEVLKLPSLESEAVMIWYAFSVKEGGGYWTPADKAAALDLSEKELRQRISSAKRRLLASCETLM